MNNSAVRSPHRAPAESVAAHRVTPGGAAALRRGADCGNRSSTVITSPGQRPPAIPVRLTLSPRLGRKIDGAWWPRAADTGQELPELIAILRTRLGEIIAIEVNWSSPMNPPKLDSFGWEGRHQRVMTIRGHDSSAKLFIVPHRTRTALAVMVLRLTAGLPNSAPHRDTPAYRTAECILRAGWTHCGSSAPASADRNRCRHLTKR